MKIPFWFITIAAAIMLLAACTQPTTMPEHNDAAMPDQVTMTDESDSMTESADMTEAMTETVMADDMMNDSQAMTDTMVADAHTMTETTEMAVDDADAKMQELPAWQTLVLTDARSGEQFSLADFAGKTVFVETMATWCPNCRQQLGNVKSAAARVDAEAASFVAISVETTLAADTLAKYADDNGFDWTFAVATPEMVQALADTFGQTIANPPATPHFIIQPDGSYSELFTGFESGDQILANLGQ